MYSMYSVLDGAFRNNFTSLNAVNYIPARLQPLICSEKMVRLWVVLQPVRHYWPGKKSEALPHWIALCFLGGATEQKQEVEWGTQKTTFPN